MSFKASSYRLNKKYNYGMFSLKILFMKIDIIKFLQVQNGMYILKPIWKYIVQNIRIF
jgi:hypothetical protein